MGTRRRHCLEDALVGGGMEVENHNEIIIIMSWMDEIIVILTKRSKERKQAIEGKENDNHIHPSLSSRERNKR